MEWRDAIRSIAGLIHSYNMQHYADTELVHGDSAMGIVVNRGRRWHILLFMQNACKQTKCAISHMIDGQKVIHGAA